MRPHNANNSHFTGLHILNAYKAYQRSLFMRLISSAKLACFHSAVVKLGQHEIVRTDLNCLYSSERP